MWLGLEKNITLIRKIGRESTWYIKECLHHHVASPQHLTQVLYNPVHLLFSHPLPGYHLVQRVCLALQQTPMMTTPLWLAVTRWSLTHGTLFMFLPGFARGISWATKKTLGKFKLSCALMKVRTFSFPDVEACFLPKERPSPEEIHSVPPSALAAPTEIPCSAAGSESAGNKPHKTPKEGNILSMQQTDWNCDTLRSSYTWNYRGMQEIPQLHSAVPNCKTTGLHFWPELTTTCEFSSSQSAWNSRGTQHLQTTWGCQQQLQGNPAACKILCEGDFQTLLLKISLEWWLCPDTQYRQPLLHVSVARTPFGEEKHLALIRELHRAAAEQAQAAPMVSSLAHQPVSWGVRLFVSSLNTFKGWVEIFSVHLPTPLFILL